MQSFDPDQVVIIDIDGLRRDVFRELVGTDDVPNLNRILHGENGNAVPAHVPALSVAPSITFAAQATIFTGRFPKGHRVHGNECFDRLGVLEEGIERHFGFSVGDTLSVDDALQVFTDDLADQLLSDDVETIYESAARQGKTSLVAYNMYSRGADHVLYPSVVDIARFTKGPGFLGMDKGDFDGKMLDELDERLTDIDDRPDLLTTYFLELDHYSHEHGPNFQGDYVRETLDPQLGRLLEVLEKHDLRRNTLFCVVSDHGHIETRGRDKDSIQIGFMRDKELTPLFTEMGYDLLDYPMERHGVDAVAALNGGMAHVFLCDRQDRNWEKPPPFSEVKAIAEAFHRMNQEGTFREELQGTLELILVRNAEDNGWDAPYRVYEGNGNLREFSDWIEDHDHLNYSDPVNRIRQCRSRWSGDLILETKAEDGIYFGSTGYKGTHGSLRAPDSESVLSFGYPSGEVNSLKETVEATVQERCERENDREPSIADMAHVLNELWL